MESSKQSFLSNTSISNSSVSNSQSKPMVDFTKQIKTEWHSYYTFTIPPTSENREPIHQQDRSSLNDGSSSLPSNSWKTLVNTMSSPQSIQLSSIPSTDQEILGLKQRQESDQSPPCTQQESEKKQIHMDLKQQFILTKMYKSQPKLLISSKSHLAKNLSITEEEIDTWIADKKLKEKNRPAPAEESIFSSILSTDDSPQSSQSIITLSVQQPVNFTEVHGTDRSSYYRHRPTFSQQQKTVLEELYKKIDILDCVILTITLKKSVLQKYRLRHGFSIDARQKNRYL